MSRRRRNKAVRVMAAIWRNYKVHIITGIVIIANLAFIFESFKQSAEIDRSIANLDSFMEEQRKQWNESEKVPIEKEIVYRDRIALKDNMDYTHYSMVKLSIENIQQMPELPTGCEITSLTTVINYLDPDTKADKLNLADNFLKRGEVGKTDPDEAFIGNPRNRRSFGANAPVLVDAAQNYYSTIDYPRSVENLTGTECKDLLKYVISGYPVIVWATIGMSDTYKSVTWTVNGKDISWDANFHCLVLVGFNRDENVYYFADPLQKGISVYNADLFKDRYDKIGKQAIVIY